MSVCIVGVYPWESIRSIAKGRPAAIICSDTRVSAGRRIMPVLAAKQVAVSKNLAVCFTSSNLAATSLAVRMSLEKRNVDTLASSLRQSHESWGGFTEMLAVVWRRGGVPQIMELMPPYYVPKPRSGVVGIGSLGVLAQSKLILDRLSQDHPIPFTDHMKRGFRNSVGYFPKVGNQFPATMAAGNIIAALCNGIMTVPDPTVDLPVMSLVIDSDGIKRIEHSALDLDNKITPTSLQGRDAEFLVPSPVKVAPYRNGPRSAIQLLP